MKIKSLILGSAAAMIAATGAQAADLPAAEPVEYVRICDTFGTGFFYIPGTETCLKIGGYARAELRYVEPVFSGNVIGVNTQNFTTTRARVRTTFDARTMTEYGLLRSFIDVWFTADSGAGFAVVNGATGVILWRGFVQFGGLTAGRAGSFFDYFNGYSLLTTGRAVTSLRPTNLFAYTFAFGNGFSATVSLEDGTFRRTGGNPVGFGAPAGTVGGWGGHALPDVVAALRVDQGWGSAQVAGALHQIRGRTVGSDADYGWAVMGGVTINLPMIAPGDQFAVQATYADGAVDYTGMAMAGLVGFGLASGQGEMSHAGARAAFNTRGLGQFDAVATGTGFATTTAWSIAAGFLHNWTPQISTALTGSYGAYDEPRNNTGLAEIDYSVWNIIGTVAYKPVSGLTLAAELGYESVNVNEYLRRPNGDDFDADQFFATFRVQRDF